MSWGREVGLVVGIYAAYSVVRNLTRGDAARAFVNAQHVMNLERALHLDVEQGMQVWALAHLPLVIVANYFYGSATFVVTGTVLVHLYRRHPDEYRRLRRALTWIIGLALVGYVVFPLMPPRLLDRMGDGTVFGFTDTLARYPAFWSFASSSVDRVSNQFAAMPSLHCAFALWVAWALVPRCRTTAGRVAAAAYPVITVVVVVITGNHYLLDVVGAAAVVALGAMASRIRIASR